jgi:hypothetical protein
VTRVFFGDVRVGFVVNLYLDSSPKSSSIVVSLLMMSMRASVLPSHRLCIDFTRQRPLPSQPADPRRLSQL